jgi:hypothetical protein
MRHSAARGERQTGKERRNEGIETETKREREEAKKIIRSCSYVSHYLNFSIPAITISHQCTILHSTDHRVKTKVGFQLNN